MFSVIGLWKWLYDYKLFYGVQSFIRKSVSLKIEYKRYAVLNTDILLAFKFTLGVHVSVIPVSSLFHAITSFLRPSLSLPPQILSPCHDMAWIDNMQIYYNFVN